MMLALRFMLMLLLKGQANEINVMVFRFDSSFLFLYVVGGNAW